LEPLYSSETAKPAQRLSIFQTLFHLWTTKKDHIMSAQSMLEQLLKSGLSMMDKKSSGSGSVSSSNRPGNPGWDKFGTGAAAGGVLGLLLGSKRGRSMGGTALKYGSIAALGAVAFKAYNHWQAQQAQQQTPQSGTASTTSATERSIPLLAAPAAEAHSQALLKAMIAAAKSDGHLDEREQGLIHTELDRQQADAQERRWMEEELRRPLDPAEVARAATTPELATEMYLASLLMTDDTTFMERAYLDELARQLQLAPGLKAELESQARAA
jgi:uncharacterized membrane protein YebE (DUF533 family)